MLIPFGFKGKVEAKIIKLNSPSYSLNDVVDKLNNKTSQLFDVIDSTNINFGGWKYTYMSNNKINLKLVYDENDDIYESIGDDSISTMYIIKVIKLSE